MDVATYITTLPSLVLFLLTVAIGELAAEAGHWVAKRKTKDATNEGAPSLGSLVGAMLGLLAFMLGFTFSITSSRFANRKELMVAQSNALGTCYLRTSFLPEKQKEETRKLLREYVDILVKMKNHKDVMQGVVRLDELHLLIWNQAASLAREDMDSELRMLYVTSLNEVIDIFGERKTVVLVFRIPSVLWTSLFLLYSISMFVVGYETGSFRIRRVMATPLMVSAFALIVTLIANMDSTKSEQRFRVSQQPLIELQQMMQQNIP
ncbi:hypothetical protein [Flavisolibacter tropicus]|uniref:DUF4239 domain-containing protein n=1 Tax=Flavisolibacter tropicus TaxID=1492898 RepID=A0A172U1T2_9BACT|nr:hypothetical protein [Flavisolibacter tropicus]ANE53172.1 hypothetical protein SY85_24575 [Flavisolibacter tropicus]